MKKKALLVGASAPFVGPMIIVDEGTWVVEDCEKGVNINLDINGETHFLGDKLIVQGPARIIAELVEGINVCLSLRQIANA